MMRAARITGAGKIECVDAPRPEIAKDRLLVRTLLTSICGSDLHTLDAGLGVGTYPCRCGFPGHESVGLVEHDPDGLIPPGAHVLLVPDGSANCAFADLQLIPRRFVIPLDAGDDPSVMVLAQQLGTVIFALKKFLPADESVPETAVVIGAGPAGLMFVEQLKQRGVRRVVVSERSRYRLDQAQQRGADILVDSAAQDVVEAVGDVTDGVGAGLVIEAAGHDDTRGEAMCAVAINGTVGLFGLPERPGPAPIPLEVIFSKRPTIQVSNTAQHEAGLESFREAVEMVRAGLAARGLLSHQVPISHVEDAFILARERTDSTLKVGVSFE